MRLFNKRRSCIAVFLVIGLVNTLGPGSCGDQKYICGNVLKGLFVPGAKWLRERFSTHTSTEAITTSSTIVIITGSPHLATIHLVIFVRRVLKK